MRFLIPKSRTGMIVRVFAAALIIVASSAAAVATAALLQVDSIYQDITVSSSKGVRSKQITLPKPGAPQTLLVIGSDHRANSPSFRDANTDTILLLRLNAASSTINIMSIPRDLRVQVPLSSIPAGMCGEVQGDQCIEKINAAYSEGGYGLLIKTIKANVFPDLKVNHIVDTNFNGFSDIVNAIGCVYADVDHRYFNQSEPAPSPDNYSSIDIQPGYQRLCGNSQVSGALAFVRFRHTDSDFVREARQQDFLRWAKQNLPLSTLFAEKAKLLKIFGKHTTLDQDLKTQTGLLELFDLVVNLNGHSLKQIPFPATETNVPTDGAADYVYPQSAQAISGAFNEFMRATPAAAATPKRPVHTTTATHHRASGHAKGHHAPSINTSGLTSGGSAGAAQARVLTPDMPVFYPKLIPTGVGIYASFCTDVNPACLDGDEPASAYAHSYPRQYKVLTTGGKLVHAYFMTIVLNAALGEYVGVQGLHWTDPPILKNAAATKTFRGRKLYLYEDDAGHVTDVAFRSDGNAYWISNTLTSTLSAHQMIGMAESMVQYGG